MFASIKTLSSKHQLIILILLVIGLNANTLFNEYAVDDAVVLTSNQFVLKGVKGIPQIIVQDYFKGLGGLKGNELSGGRWRPFSLIIFAIEYQFFGANPIVSHLLNILLFALLIALLFIFLNKYIFFDNNSSSLSPPFWRAAGGEVAFITCLLFVFHPIHTEVIANVKSRDEIIAFILIILSLIAFLKHFQKKNVVLFISGLITYFLALLTKESSLALLGIFPLILYFFFRTPVKTALLRTIPLAIVFIVYFIIRLLIIGFTVSKSEFVLNSPFLYATSSQAFATKVFIFFKYIGLLIFPHPLASDYAYNQIPYVNLFSAPFIFSAILIVTLLSYALYRFKSKSVVSFCILYYFFSIFLVTNFVVNIGAPMAERLLFQPSLAICILGALLYFYFKNKSAIIVNSVLVVVLLLFSFKTITRNAEWKNNDTLYFADVKTSPNSLRTNTYASESYLNKANAETDIKLKTEYLNQSVFYGEHAMNICADDAFIYMNLGSAYFGLGDYFKSADLWQKAYILDPKEPEATKAKEFISSFLLKKGNALYEHDSIAQATIHFQKAVELNNKNTEGWYNLGGIYYLLNDSAKADSAWLKVKLLDAGHRFNKNDFSK